MPAAISAAEPFFEMELFCKHHKALLVIIEVDAFNQFAAH